MKHRKMTTFLAVAAVGIMLNSAENKLRSVEPRIETLFYSGWTFYAGNIFASKEAGGYVDVDYFRLGTELSPESK